MHPLLPSGVHLKALETYDLIFRIIGTDRLVQELYIYSNGVFPLLSHAAINVKPALLDVYATHFVPLGDRLRPALDGFVIAVLPGLEEGSDHYHTTETLLKDVCEGVGKTFFYSSIWRCILYNPSVRLAGVTFVLSQFNKKKGLEEQIFILGNNGETFVSAVCSSLLDENVLVQRAILDLLNVAFPLHQKVQLEPGWEGMSIIPIVTAASTVLLRRDITLNRRLFSWLRNNLDNNPTKPSRKGDHFFDRYSRPFVSAAFVHCLTNRNAVISPNSPAWSNMGGDLWPYKLLICLLDRGEIRATILDNLITEVFRALYTDSKSLVENNGTNSTVPTSSLISSSPSPRQRNQRVDHMANLIITNIGIGYTWRKVCQLFKSACRAKFLSYGHNNTEVLEESDTNDDNDNNEASTPITKSATTTPNLNEPTTPLSIEESCSIVDYMSEVTYDSDPEMGNVYLPILLNHLLKSMIILVEKLSVSEFNSIIQLSSKITTKLQSIGIERSKTPESMVSTKTTKRTRVTTSLDPAYEALHDIREESEGESLSLSLGLQRDQQPSSLPPNISASTTETSSTLARSTSASQVGPVLQAQSSVTSSSSTTSNNETSSLSSMSLSGSLAFSESTVSIASSTVTLTAGEEGGTTPTPGGRVVSSGGSRTAGGTTTQEREKETEQVRHHPFDDDEEEDESFLEILGSSVTTVYLVKKLFTLFVRERLVSGGERGEAQQSPKICNATATTIIPQRKDYYANKKFLLNRFFDRLSHSSSSCPPGGVTSTSSNYSNNNSDDYLPLQSSMIPVYDNICQLLTLSSLIPKEVMTTEGEIGIVDDLTESEVERRMRVILSPHTPTQYPEGENVPQEEKERNTITHDVTDGDEHDGNVMTAHHSQSSSSDQMTRGIGSTTQIGGSRSAPSAENNKCSSRRQQTTISGNSLTRPDVIREHRNLGQQQNAEGSLNCELPEWIRYLLVLCTFTQENSSYRDGLEDDDPKSILAQDPGIKVAYTSISTFLSLVRILKGFQLQLPPSSISMISKTSPLSTPVLEFTTSGSFSSTSKATIVDGDRESTATPINEETTQVTTKVNLVDPLISSNDLQVIASRTNFYHVVVSCLWEKMSDRFSGLHLETANLIQQIHNLSPEEDAVSGKNVAASVSTGHPICETVICSSMASSDESIAYEARKRFCILYNITRDIEGRAPLSGQVSTTQPTKTPNYLFERREFDRPLFFLLDSLTHKLDPHNALAVDWLNQCLKSGDIARILEPLLFILLHPDTSRVSVQHVNIQQPDNDDQHQGGKQFDEADAAAAAALESRIYAISSTGGNVIYHVNPEGYNSLKRRGKDSSSPVPPKVAQVVAVTNVDAKASAKSTNGNKWVTTKFNLNNTDYEVPPSHEQNIISGKYTSINTTLNLIAFGNVITHPEEKSTVDQLSTTPAEAKIILENIVSNAKRLDTTSSKTSQPARSPGKVQRSDTDLQARTAKTARVHFTERKSASEDGVLSETSSEPKTDSSVVDTETVVGSLLEDIVEQVVKSEGEEDNDSDDVLVDHMHRADKDKDDDIILESGAFEEGDSEEDDHDDDQEEDSVSTESTSSAATTTTGTVKEPISIAESNYSIGSGQTGQSWTRQVSVNQLHSHLLLYSQVYDSRRTLYALTTLWNVILTDPSKVLFAMSTTSISNRLGHRSQELQSLCARHQKSLLGKGFYTDLDTESVTSFRSATFLEVVITTCLYFIRSYYPGLPNSRLTEEEILGNQRVRILSSEILRLIFSELIPEIKGKPNFTSYLHDMLMRCRVQKVALHSLVASVYNLQYKNGKADDSNNNTTSSEDSFSDTIISLNEKVADSQTFQEDMQKSLIKLLEQLMILEHKSSPQNGSDKSDLPTHSRKPSDSNIKASRIRFQPQMSSLKYCPKVPIPSQAMFLSAIQTALQMSSTASGLHPNWLQLVESSLPYAGRSLTRLVVCVVSQLCHNLELLSELILDKKVLPDVSNDKETNSSKSKSSDENFVMPPNHLTILLKSLGSLCHYCLCDSSGPASSGTASPILSPSVNGPGGTSGSSTSGQSNTGGGSIVSLNPLSTISNLLHVLTSESLMSENHDKDSKSSHDPLSSTRRTLLTHLPRILGALRNIWKAVTTAPLPPMSNDRRPSFYDRFYRRLSSSPSIYSEKPGNVKVDKGWEVMGHTKDVKMAVLSLLSPISLLHGSHFMGAVALVWYDLRESKVGKSQISSSTTTLASTSSTLPQPASVIPKCSSDQLILVDLIAAVKVLPMDLIIQHVKQVLKSPPATTAGHSKKKRVALEVCLLQFFLAYIRHSSEGRSQQLYDCWKSLLSLIREGLSYSSNQPLAQFHLLAILHDFVQAAPLIEDRRDQKDLQDVAQKLLDACTTVAGARLAQTKWLRRNLEVRPGPHYDDYETDGESTEPSSPRLSLDHSRSAFDISTAVQESSETGSSILAKFSVQALNALAEFVAPVLDVVYVSEEKEKVVPLVSNIMCYVTPYLRNHSRHNAPSFMAGSHLLSSITGYTYSRKAWRKEAFELLIDPAFFQMEEGCLPYWRVIVDHLMTHDKTTFREFLSRMSVTQSGSLKLFSSKEAENEQRAQLAKRLAFILFCSEKDQYQRYMPDIQEKLIECLRMNSSSPNVQAQILLCFRVLLVRMSHQHLTSLWPFIYTEMVQAFLQIECELNTNTPTSEFK